MTKREEKSIRINELENILLNNHSWLNLNSDIRERIAYLKGCPKEEVQIYLNRAKRKKTAEELLDLGKELLHDQ